LQVKLTPPSENPKESPAGMAEVVVTVADVVVVDDEAEHDVEQGRTDPKIMKLVEGVAGVIPGLVAVSVYGLPGRSIDRSENEAIPPLALTVKVPDSDPEFGFDWMATVTAAVELVSSWPDPSKTSTLTGPPVELYLEVITAPAAVLAGSPSAVKASEHDLVTEPERFPALAGSSRKALPVPLKSFDCLAAIPHWYIPLPHVAAAVTVKVVVAPGASPLLPFRSMKSAELDVKLTMPEALEAPVIRKPAGAEIWTEPSDWGDASFVIVNVKDPLAPAVGFVGDTVTAKHFPVHVAAFADPAADAASIATASMLAASTPKITRATVKPAFFMAVPSSASIDCKGRSASAGPHCQPH
jgi:hypothetical protein